jgi:methylation protein EvaC
MYDFGLIPKSGFFLKNVDDSYPQETLRFYYCLDCAGVFRENSDSNTPDYSHVDRSTTRQIPNYLDQILFDLRLKDDEFIIEVGSNDGYLLEQLKSKGAKNILGIEPSYNLSQRCKNNGFKVECTHLDWDNAEKLIDRYGYADVVMCRHTLEHVPHPRDFLRAIYLLLKESGRVFIEVPSLMPIIDQRLHGYEFWDEHLSYFSEETLQNLLIETGFEISGIESREHGGSENILCWARKASQSQNIEGNRPIGKVLELSETFAFRWDEFKEHLSCYIKDLPRPIAALGASHPQINFLHFTGISLYIDQLIDDDLHKRGQFVPSFCHPVITSEESISLTMPTILDTAFGYPRWIESLKNKLKRKPQVVIEPFKLIK